MSVQVQGANRMMSSQKNEGASDSGGGVVLAGFYAPNPEVGERLKALEGFSQMALAESEGWTFFLASSETPGATANAKARVFFFRRESHKFFSDLPSAFYKTKATQVLNLSLSLSSGFLSLAMLYRTDSDL